jgi:methylase of polypeptide subunit release factors
VSVDAAPVAETMAFGPLTIRYDDRVLRPRPWTAMQSEWAAELLATAPAGRVLELCAGAGHIGLLGVHGTDRELVMVDLNPVACDFARQNAAATRSSVEVREGSMDRVVADDESFVLVIADPPWVTSDRTTEFPEDPLIAIDGGVDGMTVAWMCIDVVAAHLHDDGSALLQLGDLEQVERLRAYVAERPALRLAPVEVRSHEDRGVVVRLVRP